MSKISMTFRLSPQIADRLQEIKKRGGDMTEVVEKSLEDRFAVKDGAKLLAKVNQDQQTVLNNIKAQTEEFEEWKAVLAQAVETMNSDRHRLISEIKSNMTTANAKTTASLDFLERNMASLSSRLSSIERQLQEADQTKVGFAHQLSGFSLAMVGIVFAGAVLVGARYFGLIA